MAPGALVLGPCERQSRCACALTREARAIYAHVRLPTTRARDAPARNCQTLWWAVRRGGGAGRT